MVLIARGSSASRSSSPPLARRAAAAGARAQDWKGTGRIEGRCRPTTAGAPLAGATRQARLPRARRRHDGEDGQEGPLGPRRHRRRHLALRLRARGPRDRRVTSSLPERVGRLAPLEVKLEEGRGRREPRAELQAAAAKAEAAYKEGRFAEARAEYEKLLALRPDLAPPHPPADRLLLDPGEAVRQGRRGARAGARGGARQRADPRDRRAGRARGRDGGQGTPAARGPRRGADQRAPTSSSTSASTSSTPARRRTRCRTSQGDRRRRRLRRRLLPARARVPRPGQDGRGQGRLPEGRRARSPRGRWRTMSRKALEQLK